MKRREFCTLAATAVAVAGCGGSDEAQAPAAAPEPPAPEPEEEKLAEFLFVQHFRKGTLKDNVLTLEGIAEESMYFSDRPDRIVGRETIEEFVESWDEGGEESFAAIPPNGVATVVEERESRDVVLVFKDPVLTGDTLVYQVEVLDGPLEAEGEYGTVFIDALGSRRRQSRRVARRTARRTTRRVNDRDDDSDSD